MINKISQHYLTPTLMPALQPAIAKLMLGTFAEVVAALAKIGALLCLIQLIDDLSSKWIFSAIGLWIVSAAVSSLASWWVHEAESQFASQLRRQVAQHLARLPSKTVSRYGENQLRRLASEDINTLHHMIAHLPSEFVTFMLVPLASILIMLSLAGPIALLALIPGLIASLYYLLFLPKYAAKYGTERMNIMGEIVTAVNDYTRGIRVNRIYGTQSGAIANYRHATQRFTDGIVKWVSNVALAAAVSVALLQAVATLAIAYTISYELSPAAMASVFFFGLAIVTPVLKLGHGLDYVTAGKKAAKHISDFLQESTIASGQVKRESKSDSLHAEHIKVVTEQKTIINDLSYSFLPGSFTAIMGPSGVGKSTFLRILSGYEQPSSGTVTLGHDDISDLDEVSRHNAIRFVPQNTGVLKTTVRENLQLATPDATDDTFRDALSRAQLIIDLAADASSLSGGQQQRISLANVFLTNANIILLDEPTSALDKETALLVMQNLRSLAHQQGKTIIVVTHDSDLAQQTDFTLTLTRNADKQDEEV